MTNNTQPCDEHDSKILNSDVEKQSEEKGFDRAKRGQCANDGLPLTASLTMGVGAVRKDVKIMMLTGLAGLVGGACSIAIGEFVSVYSQYDIELAQMKRKGNMDGKDKLPNPYYAAFASAVTFVVGAGVPLLGAAFVSSYKARLGALVAVVTLALIGFGCVGAFVGKAPMVKSTLRVLIVDGWPWQLLLV